MPERIKSEYDRIFGVDEGRKRVLGVMAAILAARKLAQQDSAKPSPALNCAIADAITLAQRIMAVIDGLFPRAPESGN
jgi:hypothetical protein